MAFGRNVAGLFAPIRPAEVTARICGSAHEALEVFRGAAAAPAGTRPSTAATMAALRPTLTPIDPLLETL